MDRTRRLAISLVLTAVLAVVEIGFGVVAHSSGLLADAGHNLSDLGALVLSLVAVRLALRPPNAARSFGNHRATILAALANAALIAIVTVLIVLDSFHRLGHPEHVRAGLVIVVASFGLVVNGVAALVLRDGSNDLNMRAALVHMAGDALASLAVVVAAVILLFVPSATWLDPVSALTVAAIIVVQAFRVFAQQRRRPPRVDTAGPRPGPAHRGHGRGFRRGRGPRPPRLESLQRDAGALRPHGPHRSSDARGGTGGRRSGEVGHRRAVRHLPHHAGAGVRAVQRRRGSLPDGGRIARGHVGAPALSATPTRRSPE